NLQSPPGSKLRFDPAAKFANSLLQVVVVKDGKVYARSTTASWAALGAPTFTAASTPFVMDSTSGALFVIVFDNNGHTWSWDGTVWKDVTPISSSTSQPLDGFLAAPGTRPWAQLSGTNIRVFLINTSGSLAVFDGTRSEIWGAPNGDKL